ncbi:peptidoglycan-binding protein [Streptomyces sp. NPDC049906]|uniref:peptidoglycan-binding protein n=1 Tax=Streptomyces sp. NPDC049906 TaxID=3155656 RepID=UPI003449858C
MTAGVEAPGPRPDPGPVRRPRRRARAAAALALALAVAGGAGLVLGDPFDGASEGTADAPTSRADAAVAEVTRGTLSARNVQKGELGYRGDHKVVNNLGGVLTDLPSVGEVIRQGRVLYAVDDEPVVLLRGAVPVHRDLVLGAEGADVRQLNAALVALGHAEEDDFAEDPDHFGWRTHRAVQDLQERVGVEETGRLERGRVVFVPEREIRVTALGGALGGTVSAGAVVVAGTSTRRQVTVALSASQQSEVAVGDGVTITLPDGRTTPGVVRSMGTVAERAGEGMAVQVLIEPTDPGATRLLDRAPVEVSIVSASVEDVLSVPVRALLARQGGGHAVELVRPDGEHRLVPVETGLFDAAAGRVQVTGRGLAAGQRVVVADA